MTRVQWNILMAAFTKVGASAHFSRSFFKFLLPFRFRPLPLPRRYINISSTRQIRPKIYHRDGGSLYFRVTPNFSRKSSLVFSLASGLIRARSACREGSVCPVLFCNEFLVGPYLMLPISFLCTNGLACVATMFSICAAFTSQWLVTGYSVV